MVATSFSKYQWGESLFIAGVGNLFLYWQERHNLGPGRQIQQTY